MITLQYFNGKEWVDVSKWGNENIAWMSLGGDYRGYRTVDSDGKILTEIDSKGKVIKHNAVR